jgi:hypothetical protein
MLVPVVLPRNTLLINLKFIDMKDLKSPNGSLTGEKQNRSRIFSKVVRLSVLTALLLFISTGITLAHCDTMDGPVVRDAQLALNGNNINYVLKWIREADEPELKEAFALAVRVRKHGADARTLADRYFFDTLVRLHRMGEGVGFTGVKPAGTPVDDRIVAADKAIEAGNLTPLAGKVPEEMKHELHLLFDRVMALKDFDVNDVRAGREYVAAYVSFFKFAEGEEHQHAEAHNCAVSAPETGHRH